MTAFPLWDTTGTTTAGLTRDISLVTVPTAFIDDYDVHLAHGTLWQPGNTELTGYVHVLDAPAATSVTIDIPGAGAKATAKTGVDGNAPFSIKAGKLTLWSPESPKLYKVNLAAGDDKLTDEIGFRDFPRRWHSNPSQRQGRLSQGH